MKRLKVSTGGDDTKSSSLMYDSKDVIEYSGMNGEFRIWNHINVKIHCLRQQVQACVAYFY